MSELGVHKQTNQQARQNIFVTDTEVYWHKMCNATDFMQEKGKKPTSPPKKNTHQKYIHTIFNR